MMYFFHLPGNGVSPVVVAEWLISSYHCIMEDKETIKRRKLQIKSLYDNMEIKKHERFYYSLFHKRLLYFDGRARDIRNETT